MRKDRPYIITLLGDLNILGAIILIIFAFPNILGHFGITVQSLSYMNVPLLPKEFVMILYAILILIISYGYLKLKRWGYWLMVGLDLLPIISLLVAYLLGKSLFSMSTSITTMIHLIYLVPTYKYFYQKVDSTQ